MFRYWLRLCVETMGCDSVVERVGSPTPLNHGGLGGLRNCMDSHKSNLFAFELQALAGRRSQSSWDSASSPALSSSVSSSTEWIQR